MARYVTSPGFACQNILACNGSLTRENAVFREIPSPGERENLLSPPRGRCVSHLSFLNAKTPRRGDWTTQRTAYFQGGDRRGGGFPPLAACVRRRSAPTDPAQGGISQEQSPGKSARPHADERRKGAMEANREGLPSAAPKLGEIQPHGCGCIWVADSEHGPEAARWAGLAPTPALWGRTPCRRVLQEMTGFVSPPAGAWSNTGLRFPGLTPEAVEFHPLRGFRKRRADSGLCRPARGTLALRWE